MKSERYALLLGSSKFNDNNYNKLECVVNDIDGVKSNLLKFGDFKEENIKVLLDDNVFGCRREIEKFLNRVQKNDFILFYYSGHGELDRDTNKLYFIMKDTEREFLNSTSIDKDFIYDCLEKYKPKGKVFIIDCCYSGAFVKPTKSGVEEEKIAREDIAKCVDDGRGCFILTASRANKTVPAGKKYSLFTEVLLEGIETGKACKSIDGKIYPDDLHDYISKNIEKSQNPVANFTNIESKNGLHIVTIKQSVDSIMKTYNEIIAEEYSKIYVIGRNDKGFRFKLDDIYIPLTISKDKHVRSFLCEGKIKDNLVAKDLLEFNINRIIVKGEPGMGKTTMLRYLAGIERTNRDDKTPVYIKLSEFKDSNDSLISFIIDNIKYFCMNIEREMLIKALEEGKIIILLDGLDEVKESVYMGVIKKIKEFSNTYRNCKIILTSRNYGFKFIEFTDYIFEIDNLPLHEIEKYVAKFYEKCETEERAKIKINSLISSIKVNEEIEKMAKNPFLLSILCLVGQQLDTLPKHRVELYKECTLLLLKRKHKAKECRIRTKEKILKEVAFKFFNVGDGYSEFDYYELEDFINGLIEKDEFNDCKGCNAEKCIDSFCEDSGIMKKFKDDKYGFSHRTFCEYYASFKFDDLTFNDLIEKSKSTKWEEPVKLYSARIKNKNEGQSFIEKLWNTNRELALRCYPEMVKIIDKEFIEKLLHNISVRDRIGLINGLNYVDGNVGEKSNIEVVIDTLKVLLELQTDLEVLCHGILRLENIMGKVEDGDIRFRINRIIESVEGTEVIKKERYDKYIKNLMVDIEGGEFLMGSPKDEYYRENNEKQHRVKLSNFKISKFTITKDLFEKVLAGEGFSVDEDDSRESGIWDGSYLNWKKVMDYRYDVNGKLQKEDNHPVIHVNWYESYMFCRLLGCKLPTEAEWEYACRGKGENRYKPFNTGDNLTTDQSNYNGNYPYKNNKKGVYIEKTTPVDKYEPNDYGLYDMHGNVWEWCMDWYGDYDKDIVENPIGSYNGSNRVLCGGSWYGNAMYCRSAYRGCNNPDFRYSFYGFRLVSHSS